MNAVIEVEAASGEVLFSAPRSFSIRKYAFVEAVMSFPASTSTSITRFFSKGSTSQNAVSPVNYFIEGGLAVA